MKHLKEMDESIAKNKKDRKDEPFLDPAKAERQANALEKVHNELSRVNSEIAALDQGGLAMYRLAQEAARADSQILEFKKTLQRTNLSQAEQNRLVAEYSRLREAQVNQEAMNAVIAVGQNAFGELERSIGDMVKNGTFNLESFRDVAKNVLGDIASMIIKLGVTNPIMNGLFGAGASGNSLPTLGNLVGGAGSGLLGGLFSSQGALSRLFSTGSASFIGPMPIPGFAEGGSPPVGMPSVVGEDGWEMWVPDEPGNVLNQKQLKALGVGGKREGDVNIALNVSTGVAQTVRAELRSMLPGLKNEIKQSVIDARLRGGQMSAAFN
jgi:hypothetical protein